MNDDTGWAAIALMAAITYALRYGGLLVGVRLPATGRVANLLERIPGLVLVALITPAVVALGWVGFLAAGCAVAASRATRGNLVAAIVAGAAIVALSRWVANQS